MKRIFRVYNCKDVCIAWVIVDVHVHDRCMCWYLLVCSTIPTAPRLRTRSYCPLNVFDLPQRSVDQVRVLPTVVMFIDGVVKDRVTGFEKLGDDDFPTAKVGCRAQASLYNGLPLSCKPFVFLYDDCT